MDLVAGQSLGRYEITGHLGAGGMGVVYRARDAQLGRDVAVKVLNDRAAANPSRIERFAREARAVARLSHPNILDIHDFGTHDGITYAVTELLKGHTLADRIDKGPIPLNKGLEICSAIAKGLSAAHGEGIVHRDIKPSNIFITDTGQVKVLDFGIARLREQSVEESSPGSEAATESMTGAGGIVGTVGYMSPEQIDGGKVDGRSDIFGLGCVMYEVLTGKRAFRGKTSTDIMLAILGKDPEPIRSLNEEVPQTVDLIVQRCLEKQPGERFESARDVAFSLKALADSQGTGYSNVLPPKPSPNLPLRFVLAVLAVAVATSVGWFVYSKWLSPPPPGLPEVKHLAVIPFEAVGGDLETAQFTSGLSEIIADDLEWLTQRAANDSWVVPPTTARTSDTADVETMYRRFNANVALTGSVERRGPLLNVTLTSVEAETGSVFASVDIDIDLGNVSSLQLDPVERAAEVVGIEFTEEIREHFSSRATNVARAFELYVRARGIMAAASEEGDIDAAVELLEEATSLDPLFVPAREALAQALAIKFDESGERDFFDRSLEEVRRVVQNGPSANVFQIKAALHASDGDHDEAVAALERAVELFPENGAAYRELGAAYQKLGRTADAERAFQRSANLRPGYWKGPDALARLYLGEGRYDAAANACRRVIDCAPLNRVGYNVLGVIQFLQDDLEAARLTFERSIGAAPTNNYFAYANLGTLHFNAARFADAIGVYEHALAISDSDYQVWGNLAFAYAFGAEPEKAQEPFDRAIKLAEEMRQTDPDNAELFADLASYYAMVDLPDTSRDFLERVTALNPNDPQVFAKVGETYEDLNDREAALEWISRALDADIPPRFFEARPMLRDLISDSRYQQLVAAGPASPQ